MHASPKDSPETVRAASVMGFVYVSDVDEERRKIKLLATSKPGFLGCCRVSWTDMRRGKLAAKTTAKNARITPWTVNSCMLPSITYASHCSVSLLPMPTKTEAAKTHRGEARIRPERSRTGHKPP
ncbi:calcium-transporting ATPase 3 [Ilyonectria robusta]